MIRLLARRRAEDAETDAFVRAIRRSAYCGPWCTHPVMPAVPATVPLPRVVPVQTPAGEVWELDEMTRARFDERDTMQLPRIVLTASAPLR